ncbi:hypothetical protein B0H17DRAFT_1104741, partial [Mycena rosella]
MSGADTPLALRIPSFLSPLPINRAAAVAAGAREFQGRWFSEWAKSPRARPSNSTQKMYGGLSRPQCSVLAQMCTGHIGLNTYLYRFHLAPSPNCPSCPAP